MCRARPERSSRSRVSASIVNSQAAAVSAQVPGAPAVVVHRTEVVAKAAVATNLPAARRPEATASLVVEAADAAEVVIEAAIVAVAEAVEATQERQRAPHRPRRLQAEATPRRLSARRLGIGSTSEREDFARYSE